jgi:sigma-B regulation protein RsbU (phosphoserine phosphatase)
MLIRANGSIERLEEGGIVLGIFGAASYLQKTTPFDPGDILILYSDGVVEACPADADEEFGEERLVRIVGENLALPLPRLIGSVMEALKTWSGDGSYADDVTIMLARRSAGEEPSIATVALT